MVAGGSSSKSLLSFFRISGAILHLTLARNVYAICKRRVSIIKFPKKEILDVFTLI